MSYNTQQKITDVCFYRGLPPVKKGMRCEVDGRKGTIEGGNGSANFNVQFDGIDAIRNCHPEWRMTVFNDDGSILYRRQD